MSRWFTWIATAIITLTIVGILYDTYPSLAVVLALAFTTLATFSVIFYSAR